MSFSHKEIPLIDQFVKALVSLENLNRFRCYKAQIKQFTKRGLVKILDRHLNKKVLTQTKDYHSMKTYNQ